MEINITEFFNDAALINYSASTAELGNNASRYTWRAACEGANDWDMLDSEDKREAFRTHMAGFGAWDDTEIAAWDHTELNALFIQLIAGDMREVPGMDSAEGWNWDEFEMLAQEGVVSGSMFKGDNGEIYYYLGD